MTCKKNLKKAALAISLAVVPSFAMEQVKSASAQNSPRKLSMSSPRNSGILSLNRSGSNSNIAIAAVAHSTLKRVVTPDKLETLKKRNSMSSVVSPRNSSEIPSTKPTSEEKLADLRSSLDRSKSPLENGEAEPVFGEQDLQVALLKLEGIKTSRNPEAEDGPWTPRNSAVEELAKESPKRRI